MSYIRAGQEPNWEDVGTGLYVYSDKVGLVGMPTEHRAFTEVVMQMLDQSNELEEETLTDVHRALRNRLHIEAGEPGRLE